MDWSEQKLNAKKAQMIQDNKNCIIKTIQDTGVGIQ